MTESNIASLVVFIFFAGLGLYWIANVINRKAYIKSREMEFSHKTIDETLESIRGEQRVIKEKINAGQDVIKQADTILNRLKPETDQIEAGLMPPSFSYNHPEDLKKKIRACRQKQYRCIMNDKATNAYSTWTWFGSKSDGAKMVEEYKSLLIKAFNADFDTIIRKLRYSTQDSAYMKVDKVVDQLAKLSETAGVEISSDYHTLKIEEFNIWAAEITDQHEQKEDRKAEKALLRENNQKANDESEDLENEISATEIELRKAKKKAEALAGAERAKLEKLEKQIAKIELEKLRLEEKFARSVSQAQITKAGYIYCISNIGCFGEGVFKIGMTRRLEPMDRVRELGDASVPFKFDVHTLAFVKDAPAAEKRLHKKFHEFRVNTENFRREFFRVPVEDVQAEFQEMGIDSDWFIEVEAQQYRESELMRKAMNKETTAVKASTALPESI